MLVRINSGSALHGAFGQVREEHRPIDTLYLTNLQSHHNFSYFSYDGDNAFPCKRPKLYFGTKLSKHYKLTSL